MGVVYEALNDAIERRVAIKVLHAEYAKDKETASRFFDEARAVNRIEHPSLVQVSDYGRTADDTAYLVMEFLRGESLAQRLDKTHAAGKRLELSEVIRIAWQTADALRAAHEKSIVHRDMKPDNLMLVRDPIAPGGERVKILDFGIAKAVAAAAGETLPGVQTATGLLVGTPTYMAPEQCRGGVEVTERADVYSLGVVLYQLLSGAPPFVSTSPGDVIAMHILEPLPPLPVRAPDVAQPVTQLVTEMLSKKPTDRPSMAEVVDKLHALRNLEPKTVMLPPEQLAAKLAEVAQAMPTTEMRANETRMFSEKEHSPSAATPVAAVQKSPPAKSVPAWLLVAVLCAVILGGVTAAMLLR